MPLTPTFRTLIDDEFSFCCTPKIYTGRDRHLIDCLQGLQYVFDRDIPFSNNSQFTLIQIGVHNGIGGVDEYLSLVCKSA